ncbi:MAG: glycosyl transferase [Gammaproteobacteria bacterium]
MKNIHIYTSINLYYLPKARVLANSVKKLCPQATFHLMLSDEIPDWLSLDQEPFDHIIVPEDLGIENINSWIFKHSVVELCTAVKPFAAQKILERDDTDVLFYFDPDIVLFSNIDDLIQRAWDSSILLTPHVTVPETEIQAIRDNEISCLKHGIFNLGFLGLKNDQEGTRFAKWWGERLLDFCYDDIPEGLFTDQKWCDFAPVFFPSLDIVREPQYNASTWNYTSRQFSGSREKGIKVNQVPLCFYHFSGFDNGAHEYMRKRYQAECLTLKEMESWYKAVCAESEHLMPKKLNWKYGSYENGEPVLKEHRLMYRKHSDLEEHFPNPFEVDTNSFFAWCKSNINKSNGTRKLHLIKHFRPLYRHLPLSLKLKLKAFATDLGIY